MPAKRPPVAVESLEGRTLFATTLPADFGTQSFVTGLSAPTSMAYAPDGRLFVTEQAGKVRVVTPTGSLLPTPFLSLTTDNTRERGLLGLAFDPNFASNKYVYVYYTATTPTVHNRLSRFTADGNVVVPGSEKVLLDLDTLSTAGIHNGGALHFGKDGKLYVAVGDNAQRDKAQTLDTLLGKMVRINADGTIPTDNPFYNQTTGRNRAIWARGLRNPFTFSVQPGSGKTFINDVGQNTWEEVNLGRAGANYGWPGTEGATTNPLYDSPYYAYLNPYQAAITGGAFYNPTTQQFPNQYVGDYFFADYALGTIRTLDTSGSTPVASDFLTGQRSIVDLDVAPNGSLMALQYEFGRVLRISYQGAQKPSIIDHPDSKQVSVGQPVTFTVGAQGTGTLSYKWTRNGTTIPGATGTSYTIPSTTLSDHNAVFRAVVTNAAGSTTSNAATLTVTTNKTPVASITSPTAGTLFSGGQTFTFAGSATDAEDGTLAASRFTWRVDLHHADHTHPVVPTQSGSKSGTFTVPTFGHTETNLFYRITLKVTDSGGLTHTVTRDVQPRIVNLTLGTNLPGLSLTLDGKTVSSPTTTGSVVGVTRTIGAPASQTLNGVTYRFTGWSDGKAATHDVTTPATNATYTANYVADTNTPTTTGLNVTYYNNADFTGTTVSRIDPAVNFSWARGTPDASIGVETFSARWTGKVTPQFSQTYTFFTQADDRARLWINGQLVVDAWIDGGVKERSGTIGLTAGVAYDVRLDYVEQVGDATVRLLWASASQPKQIIPTSRLTPSPNGTSTTSGLNVTYFNNADFTGSTVTRVDANINFSWQGNSPNASIAADTFSARWTGKVIPQYSQTYTFYTQADDRARVWINGQLVVDAWIDGGVKERSGTIALTAGVAYDVRVDYVEQVGDATVRLLWSSASQVKQIIPTDRLRAV